MDKMKAISLFSGAGGLDIGFEDAGFDIVFANEFDHDAAETWKANRKGKEDVMYEGDIKDCLSQLSQFKGSVDVVFGGPPCQGFSVAGKMDPDDERSQLIFTFLEAVEIVRPKFFIMENVKALGVLNRWNSIRDKYLREAERIGYSVKFKVFKTSDFGVPQKRERVIFFGIREGNSEPFFTRMENSRSSSAPSAREVLLSAGAYGSADNPDTCSAVITLAKSPVMRKSPYAGMLVNGAGRPVDLDGFPPTLPATMGGNKTPIIDQNALEHPDAVNWFVTYHEMVLSNGNTPPAVKLPNYLRRLTLKEAAAIQTFPAGYVFCGARNKQYRQIGNAVPALFAKEVAKALVRSYYNDLSRE